jgi:hypothetical protein
VTDEEWVPAWRVLRICPPDSILKNADAQKSKPCRRRKSPSAPSQMTDNTVKRNTRSSSNAKLADGGVITIDSSSDSSQAPSDNQPRNRTSRRNQTSRTHQDMLTRCVRNESDETPNAGLANNGVICYANAIFQALANLIILHRCSMILRQITTMVPSHSITQFVWYYVRWWSVHVIQTWS